MPKKRTIKGTEGWGDGLLVAESEEDNGAIESAVSLSRG